MKVFLLWTFSKKFNQPSAAKLDPSFVVGFRTPPELTLAPPPAAAAWLGDDGVFSAKITFLGMNENHK